MLIGGLQKFSLLDYPEHLSAIIFTKGCNFRCRFCYNPMLVLPAPGFDKLKYGPSEGLQQEDHYSIEEDDLFEFLKSRQGKLDGIVITGGEPTLHPDLPEFIIRIRDMGYKIKLDTNGTNPEILEKLLQAGLIDYLAMDIKAAPDKYEIVTGVAVNLENIRKSVKIIMTSGLPSEFRTTIVPGLIEADDIEKMGQLIKGADLWYLQQFKSDTALVDEKMQAVKAYSHRELEKMAEKGGKWVGKCVVR